MTHRAFFRGVVGALLLVAVGSAACSPVDDEPGNDALPGLQPVPQAEIVETTETLAADIEALNAAQVRLQVAIESGAGVEEISGVRREAVALGLSVGITADLLASAISHREDPLAEEAATMYQDVARAAYFGAYTLAYQAPEDLAGSSSASKALTILWSHLNGGGAGAGRMPAVFPDTEYLAYQVTVEDGAEMPAVAVSVSGDRERWRLDGLTGFITPDMALADVVISASNPATSATLDDLKKVVAGRIALYAEPKSRGGEEYVIDLPARVLVSLGVDVPDAGTLYEVLADSEIPAYLWTFVKERLLPSQETQERMVRQVITRTAIDALLDPDGGPDLDMLATLIGGGAPAGGPSQPQQVLSFEEDFLDLLAYTPTFRIDSIDLTEGERPDVSITVAYEGVTLPATVWCVVNGNFRIAEVDGRAGTVRFGWSDAFDPFFSGPDSRRIVLARYGCASAFGLFGEGVLNSGAESATPPPATPTPEPTATPDRGPDTPPGTTLENPAGTFQGTVLVVEVAYANPSGAALPITCHFNGPAFSGAGGFTKTTQTITATSGSAQFAFDLGGPPEPGTYDITCVLNDDISRSNRVEVAAEEWSIYSLEAITEQTHSALGLIVAEASAVNDLALCSLSGGGLDCSVTIGDYGGADPVLGPFATRAEAEQAYCDNIVEGSVKGYWYPIATFKFDGQEHPIPNGPSCRQEG